MQERANLELTSVADFMLRPAQAIGADQRLAMAERKMSELGVSALPVVDVDGRLRAVISRTDLLLAGRVRVHNGASQRTLMLPDARVGEYMHTPVEVVAPNAALREAVQRMVRRRIHRLYVVEDSMLRGVLGSREVMRAVVDARLEMPIQEIMSASIVVVRVDDPLALAVDRMSATHHRVLAVVDDVSPVGMFGQAEAIAARDAPPGHHVQEWMDPRILCLPLSTPAHRAAEQGLTSGIHTLLAVDGEGVRGIVTATDFARLIEST